MQTYNDFQAYIASMTPEQRNNDVSIAILSHAVGGVEVVPVIDFVNPAMVDPNDTDYKEAVCLDEINDSILDEGHCYITVTI